MNKGEQKQGQEQGQVEKNSSRARKVEQEDTGYFV